MSKSFWFRFARDETYHHCMTIGIREETVAIVQIHSHLIAMGWNKFWINAHFPLSACRVIRASQSSMEALITTDALSAEMVMEVLDNVQWAN